MKSTESTSCFVFNFTGCNENCDLIYLTVQCFEDEITGFQPVETLVMCNGPFKTEFSTSGVFTSEKLFEAAKRLQEYEQKIKNKSCVYEQLSLFI
jgi:hypothetical protein